MASLEKAGVEMWYKVQEVACGSHWDVGCHARCDGSHWSVFSRGAIGLDLNFSIITLTTILTINSGGAKVEDGVGSGVEAVTSFG
jgi:hypothetical protein